MATKRSYLVYGLPTESGKQRSANASFNEFGDTITCVSIGADVSFLDFHGVVVFCGDYEPEQSSIFFGSTPHVVKQTRADLDRREKEAVSCIDRNIPVILLVGRSSVVSATAGPYDNLLGRFARSLGIHVEENDESDPHCEATSEEFADFAAKHAAGFVKLTGGTVDDCDHLFVTDFAVYGLACGSLYILPAVLPHSSEQFIGTAACALRATLSHLDRKKQSLPDWLADFSFSREKILGTQITETRGRLLQLEHEADTYTCHKSVLALQSEELVRAVDELLRHFFGITLTVNDKCVEDATFLAEDGTVIAVFEIKGVSSGFKRKFVNQVDDHRERLGLPSSTPGVLILNSMMSASTLSEKDDAPHPDIISKAVADRILMIRTLDLLRLADQVERGILEKTWLQQTILTRCGWLKTGEDHAEVVGSD